MELRLGDRDFLCYSQYPSPLAQPTFIDRAAKQVTCDDARNASVEFYEPYNDVAKNQYIYNSNFLSEVVSTP